MALLEEAMRNLIAHFCLSFVLWLIICKMEGNKLHNYWAGQKKSSYFW